MISGGKNEMVLYFRDAIPSISENEDCLWQFFSEYRDKSNQHNLSSIHYHYPMLSIASLYSLLKDILLCPNYCTKSQLQKYIWDSSCGVLYKTSAVRAKAFETGRAIITFSHFLQILCFISLSLLTDIGYAMVKLAMVLSIP